MKHLLFSGKHGSDVHFVGRGFAFYGAKNGDFSKVGDLSFSACQGQRRGDIEAAIGGKWNLAGGVNLPGDSDKFSDVGIGWDFEDVSRI